MKSITKQDVAKLHASVGSKHKTYANRIRRQLSSMFNRTKDWGHLDQSFPNPAKGVTKYAEITRDIFITEEMMPALIKAVDAEKDSQVRIGMRLYMLTGFRHAELLNLKWSDISFKNEYCRLSETKQGEVVYHALAPEVLELLKKIPRVEGNPWVFPGRKPGSHRYCLENAWKRTRKRSGLANIRLHDRRRTTGSWLAISGFSLKEIGEVLHQTNQHVTNVYARLQLKHKRPIVTAIAKTLTNSWIELEKDSA